MSNETPSLPARYAAMVAQLKRSNERIERLEQEMILMRLTIEELRKRTEHHGDEK